MIESPIEHIAEVVTLGDCLRAYLGQAARSAHWILDVQRVVRQFERWCCERGAGVPAMSELTEQIIESFAGRSDSGRAKATRSNEKSTLLVLWRFAFESGLCVCVEEPPTEKRDVRSDPTKEEIARACRRIQRGWTVKERYERAGMQVPSWLPPGARQGVGLRGPGRD